MSIPPSDVSEKPKTDTERHSRKHALVNVDTGEYIPAGAYTLDSCASEARDLIASTEKNNWRLGEILSIARALCDDPDCPVAGNNPDERYGNWVSLNLGETLGHNQIHRIRLLHEIFGTRREEVARIPQSALYALAQPQCDEIREDVLASLPEKVPVALVEERISTALGKDVIALKHTGDEESYTPAMYIESARTVMGGIDLDPASNDMAQETVRAEAYYTVEDDGLAYQWKGRVWMNPPYTAKVINEFVSKLVEHYQSGDITQAIILTNNNTDTKWFHEGASAASAICFTNGRINFLKRDGSTSSPTNGQSFFYFGGLVSSFAHEFSKYGLVMVKA